MPTANGTQPDDRPPQTVININGTTGQLDHSQVPTPTTTVTPAAPPVVVPVAGVPAPATGATTFRINGVETADFAAAQRHIDSLELVVKTTDEDGRKAFVSGLAKEGKIVAVQAPLMEAFALTLSSEAYKSWQETFAGAAPLPLLQQHGGTTSPNAGADADAGADEITILKETVATLHRIWPKEKVEKTDAFRKLTALTANKS